MILQDLAAYYASLAEKGAIARPGWAQVKVSYALEIDENGRLLQVLPLKTEKQVGKKTVMAARELELPAPKVRTSKIGANFLWDNSAYLLGFDGKGNQKRAGLCFNAAQSLHESLLGGLNDAFATAICNYFKKWDLVSARENQVLSSYIDDMEKGANLVFMYDGKFPTESQAILKAWQSHYDDDEESGEQMRCLVTGEEVVPGCVHPLIKGVYGAQSSGAVLVSFNASAFCSCGHEQNNNAPVGKYAAFAYTTALNTLLSDKKHVRRMGDTTVVYWAQGAKPGYQDAFSMFFDGESDDAIMTDDDLEHYMTAIANGNWVDWDGIPLNPDNRFYVLGLSPNAARLSVRFFLTDGFGNFVRNIKKHYENLEIISDGKSRGKHIPLWALLRETVNEKSSDKSSSPQMSGDTLRAILTGRPYPATLYQQTQLRIRAENRIDHGRAAIIKAYLIRNTNNNDYKEALKVELNENTRYQPYVLGRLFAVLEVIQERASGVTTIKDRYFSSACATPAVVFPRIIDLADKHLRKMDGGMRTYYAKQLGTLMALISESYPVHHSLYEQGVFQLGYYHQTQKRYEKKDKTETTGALDNKEEK